MKIIAQINTYQSSEYLEYVLKSIYEYAEKIVVIDGSYNYKKITPRKSTDGTFGIVSKFPDPEEKIHIHVAWSKTQHEQRSKIFNYTDGYDFLFLCDDDEIFQPSAMIKIRKFLQGAKDNVYRIRAFTFVNSFDRYYTTCNPRIWRIIDGGKEMKYIGSNNIALGNDKLFFERKSAPVIDKVWRYHYSYVRDISRLKIKEKQCYGKMNFQVKGGWFFRKDLKIKKFEGEHPEIMKNHPYRKRMWEPSEEWYSGN